MSEGAWLFVSHVSEDRDVALEIVAELERRGLKCWIAPRDIPPGEEYDVVIADAIDKCRAFLLVFSERCNENKYISRELTVAGEAGKPIIPLRIEDARPRKGLRLRLTNLHWIDAYPTRDAAIVELVNSFKLAHADGLVQPASHERVVQPEPATRQPSRPRRWLAAGSAALAVALAAIPLTIWWLQRLPEIPYGPTPTAPGVAGGNLGELVASGASGKAGYAAFNLQKFDRPTERTIDFSRMTIEDIMRLQSLRPDHPARLFAVGKYLVELSTLRLAVDTLGINRAERFTPAVQERIFRLYLIGDAKRPDIKHFVISGDRLDAAQLALAKEFPSIAQPETGQSYYVKRGAPAVAVSAEQARLALQAERQQYLRLVAAGRTEDQAWSELSPGVGPTPTVDLATWENIAPKTGWCVQEDRHPLAPEFILYCHKTEEACTTWRRGVAAYRKTGCLLSTTLQTIPNWSEATKGSQDYWYTRSASRLAAPAPQFE